MGLDWESLTEATSGAVGALVSTTALYPLDTCKTKYQAEIRSFDDEGHGRPPRYRNMSDVMWEAISSRQVLSLYQGLGTKNLQAFISQFVYFYGYSYFKRLYLDKSGFKSMGTKANLAVAAAAGACTVIVTQPLDTASSRMQTSEFGKSRGLWETLAEGTLSEAFDGIGISLLLTANPAIQYTVFDQLKQRLLKDRAGNRAADASPETLSAFAAFVLGAVSKSVATVLTYPAIRPSALVMGWTWDAVPQKRFLLGLLMLVSVTLPCAVIYQIASMPEIQRAVSSRTLKRDDPLESDSDEIPLQALLRKAAMIDNTVILTTVNEAWAAPGSVLDIFLESFRTGDRTERLLKHLVIVALDQKAYLKCKSTHSLCYALKTEGVDFSHEKFFMTPDYLKMMWRRIDFLRIVLEMGYDFIFTDSDIVWFRDPSLFLYPDGDFQIARDYFNGHPDDRRNSPNGGFNYARANNRTIEFYKFWYESKEKHPGYHDQDVLNFIKDDQRLHAIGLNMKFLPTASFGGLCQPSMDFDKVCTMHTNCCVGVERKVNDLKVMLEDWRMYRDQKPSVKGRLKPRWKVPQKCSLDMRH